MLMCLASSHQLDKDLLWPDPKRSCPYTPIAASTEAMSSWPEMTVDDGVRREEILRLIVQVSVGPVFDVRQKRTSGHAIAAQAVSDQALGLVRQVL